MRYRMDLPAVLRGVNLDIPAGSRLAVVGRTGSGKSSLAAALIRNPGPGCTAGSLLVGGRDVKTVPLARLRPATTHRTSSAGAVGAPRERARESRGRRMR
ncbi:ABC transporter [Pycnococcus provasolii]